MRIRQMFRGYRPRILIVCLLIPIACFNLASTVGAKDFVFLPNACEFRVKFPAKPSEKTVLQEGSSSIRASITGREYYIGAQCFLNPEIPVEEYLNIMKEDLAQRGFVISQVFLETKLGWSAGTIVSEKVIDGQLSRMRTEYHFGAHSILVLSTLQSIRIWPSSIVANFLSSARKRSE